MLEPIEVTKRLDRLADAVAEVARKSPPRRREQRRAKARASAHALKVVATDAERDQFAKMFIWTP